MAGLEAGLTDAATGLGRRFGEPFVRGARIFGTDLIVESRHRTAADGKERRVACWPKRGCCGGSVVQVRPVPGHEGVLPVGFGRCGGALG